MLIGVAVIRMIFLRRPARPVRVHADEALDILVPSGSRLRKLCDSSIRITSYVAVGLGVEIVACPSSSWERMVAGIVALRSSLSTSGGETPGRRPGPSCAGGRHNLPAASCRSRFCPIHRVADHHAVVTARILRAFFTASSWNSASSSENRRRAASSPRSSLKYSNRAFR